MATENILMRAVKKGANRQEIHEKIRVYSHEAALGSKLQGKNNDLLDKIAEDKDFMLSKDEISETLDPYLYTGRSASQVTSFINRTVTPLLNRLYEEITVSDLKI